MRTASALLAVVVSASIVHADPPHEKVVHEDPGATRRTASEVVALGGLGLIAGSLAVSLYARSQYDDAVHAGDIARANSQYSLAKYGGTSLALAGAAAIGVALVLRATTPERHTIITPAVAPGQVGVVLARGF